MLTDILHRVNKELFKNLNFIIFGKIIFLIGLRWSLNIFTGKFLVVIILKKLYLFFFEEVLLTDSHFLTLFTFDIKRSKKKFFCYIVKKFHIIYGSMTSECDENCLIISAFNYCIFDLISTHLHNLLPTTKISHSFSIQTVIKIFLLNVLQLF